ncbi:terpene synthase [Xylaria telfairii]|nr:terpene synthase [Xylaria telfairii]
MGLQDVPRTNRQRWRLLSENGDHHWVYLEENESNTSPQSEAERYLLGLPLTPKEQDCAHETGEITSPFFGAARHGFDFLTRIQIREGHWACDYGGPSFLLPSLIFAIYISNMPIPSEWGIEMTRYVAKHQNADGGWGLHLEGHSTVFATSMYYVMLRILGMNKNHQIAKEARNRLLSLGGAVENPHWGKIWLACLNLYDWSGVNCIPVDLWLLPSWLPFHPYRWWVQTRAVYLPTSYLWSNRCSTPLTPILEEIRDEIYTQPYASISFHRYLNQTAETDAIRKTSPLLLFMFALLSFWCNFLRPRWILRLANNLVTQLMIREEINTDYNCLSTIPKCFHTAVAAFQTGQSSERLSRLQQHLETYLWMGADGMNCNGTNGAQVWDTALTIQAAIGAGLAEDPKFRPCIDKALCFLEKSQLRDDLDDPFRQPRKGGWPFSTLSNGYIAPDCAAESLKAILVLQKASSYECRIDDTRLKECVDALLQIQNPDGGFPSYEKIRGSPYLELLNPAEIFEGIMVEYSYPECTASGLMGLSLFHRYFAEYRRPAIKKAIDAATRYIHRVQQPDGSWFGTWAICFTYATFFALQGLEDVGEQYNNSDSVRKACHFLVEKQMDDGGWGEHYSSCVEKRYIHHDTSQVVNTAWATLALMHAGYPDPTPIQRGLQLIRDRQQPNGDWLQEGLEGVFNQTCVIGYPNYKLYFPVLALGAYSHMYLTKVKG